MLVLQMNSALMVLKRSVDHELSFKRASFIVLLLLLFFFFLFITAEDIFL